MKNKIQLILGLFAFVLFFAISPLEASAAPLEKKQVQIFADMKNYAVASVEEGSFVNIREGAGTEYGKIGRLENGGLCYIKEQEGDWYLVESGEIRGYLRSDLVITGYEAWKTVHDAGEENMALASEVTTRDELVEYACQFIGNPYVWGGTSLTSGADCSGFVMKIFENYGISLPHSSKAQSGYGTRIDVADAKPGDLIFYQRGGSIYHVMIYIGNGQAVHASSKKTGIKISDVQYEKVACAVDLLG
ncbi:MAG: NlpC/P60 family protein [Fusicatenibacter sp.]|nr:C40 family peptidase [Fusicatenibacter sp.]